MKKILLIIGMVSLLLLTGCDFIFLNYDYSTMEEGCLEARAEQYCKSINQTYVKFSITEYAFLCRDGGNMRVRSDYNKKYYFLDTEIFECKQLYKVNKND